jgi:hypothetical protein
VVRQGELGVYGEKRNYYRVWEGTCRKLTILEIRLREENNI